LAKQTKKELEQPQEQEKVRATAAAARGVSQAELSGEIAAVETLYQHITGSPSPPPEPEASAPIPVERDPAEFVREQLDRLYEALAGWPAAGAMPAAVWSPRLSAWETDEELVVLLDLPGVPRDQIELSIEGTSLLVEGQRLTSLEGGKSGRLRISERPLGRFTRRILLPPAAAAAEPLAQLRDGVLEIRLAKAEPSRAGRREIRVA
jgi:HSP20 family protein